MSELSDINLEVVQDRAPITTDPVKNLRTGLSFTAEIEGNLDPFTIPESLATDPRAKFRLHVTDDTEAAGINVGDKVQFTLFGNLTTAKIVQDRNLDPASPQTRFLAIHWTEKDS